MHIKSVSLYLPRKEWNIGSLKFHPRKPGHGRGSAPYRRSDWTSRLWAMSKNGQFKTTRLRAALSLDSLEHGLNISWISELSGTPGSYASRFRNCALQRAPVRWTLTSEPTIWRSPIPCQSRNITEQLIQRLQSRGELSRWRHATAKRGSRVFTEEARTDHVIPATKNWANTLNSRETKPKHPACFNNESKYHLYFWLNL